MSALDLDLGNAVNFGNKGKTSTANKLRIFGDDSSGKNPITSYLGYDVASDGPVLAGNAGGKLISANAPALVWDAQGNVFVGPNAVKPVAGTNDLNSILTTIQKTAGPTGVGIKSVTYDSKNGNLVLNMTDGTSQGPYMIMGTTGLQGLSGQQGTPGVGVKSAAMDKLGNLVLTMTDGSSIGPFNVAGPAGPVGPPGPSGPAGKDGLGIKSVSYVNDLLTITMTDNSTQTAVIKSNAPLLAGTNPIKLDSAAVDGNNNLVLNMSDKSSIKVQLPSSRRDYTNSTDFQLGNNTAADRGAVGAARALVRDTGSALTINYAGDFKAGVNVQGPGLNISGNSTIGGSENLPMTGAGQYGYIGAVTSPGNLNATNVNAANINVANAVYANVICDANNKNCYNVTPGANPKMPNLGGGGSSNIFAKADAYDQPAIILGNKSIKDTNLYSLSFQGNAETDGSRTGMGVVPNSRKFFQDTTGGVLGMHINSSREFAVLSNGWNNLFSVQGGTGNVKAKGTVGVGPGGLVQSDPKQDWMRIVGTPTNGTALYNGLSLGPDGGRGLSVGAWRKDIPAGNIVATGTIDAAGFTVKGQPVNDYLIYTKPSQSPNKSAGWNIDDNATYWDPKIRGADNRTGIMYTDVEGRDSDCSARFVDYDVPAGVKTAHLFHLAWVNSGYFDIWGRVGSEAEWQFINRVNAFQNIRNDRKLGFHDGATIVAIPQVNKYNRIRIQGRKGRIHLMGVGWFNGLEGSQSNGLGGGRSCRNLTTPFNNEGGGNAAFLDRHNVSCDDNENLTRMQLVRNGAGQYQYQYRCCGYIN